MVTQLLNLTTTPEPFLLCDDVIICDIGLLLLRMINTVLFSVDDKHLIKVPGKKNEILSVSFLKEFPNKKWSLRGLNHLLEKLDKYDCR